MDAPDDLVIRQVPQRIARLACRHWHYSRVCPKTNLIWGYWRGDTFDGVIAFRRTLPGHTTQAWWERVFDSRAIAELCRMALRPQDERPQTTRYLSMALAEMRALGFDGIASYADTGQGHTGGVYRAGSWTELGENSGSHLWYRDGVWHPNRSLQRDGPGDWPRMRRRSIKRRYGIGLTRHGRRALARYAAEHPPGETLEDTVQGWQMAWPRPVPPQ